MRALKGGLISRVTIHAIDPRGGHKVVAVNGAGDNVYWLWDGQGTPRRCPAEPVAIAPEASRVSATARYTAR
jgi:L-asparaginase